MSAKRDSLEPDVVETLNGEAALARQAEYLQSHEDKVIKTVLLLVGQ